MSEELVNEFYTCLKRIGKLAEKHGVKMIIHIVGPVTMQPSGITCNGSFHPPRMGVYKEPILELTLWNISLETSFETMLHEYCHMTQYLDGEWCQAWNKYYNFKNPVFKKSCINLWKTLDKRNSLFEPWDIIGAWLHGEIPNSFIVDECIILAQNLEIDCEQRTVELLSSWNINNIDIEIYAKKANSYLYFYQYMKKYRFWYDDNAPYSDQADQVINDAMPPFIYKDHSQYFIIPKNIELIYNEIYKNS